MQKEVINQSGFLIMGVTARTNNINEMDHNTAKIAPLVGEYFSKSIANQIPNRVNPGLTIDGFNEYASDEFDDYTYFIWEVVSSKEDVPAGFKVFEIPAGKYVKFTTPEGKMPFVIFEAWQKIWAMTVQDLGGKRTYRIDYEVYDERAHNPDKTVVDIVIGVA